MQSTTLPTPNSDPCRSLRAILHTQAGMIRDGVLRDPERRRGGHSPCLTREQAIAIYQSVERLPVLIERYGVSRHVIVSIRGGAELRDDHPLPEARHSRVQSDHPEADQAHPYDAGSNRTIGLALGLASSSVRSVPQTGIDSHSGPAS
jgi:hypothetical protein